MSTGTGVDYLYQNRVTQMYHCLCLQRKSHHGFKYTHKTSLQFHKGLDPFFQSLTFNPQMTISQVGEEHVLTPLQQTHPVLNYHTQIKIR